VHFQTLFGRCENFSLLGFDGTDIGKTGNSARLSTGMDAKSVPWVL
jgi:hypothetical protein